MSYGTISFHGSPFELVAFARVVESGLKAEESKLPMHVRELIMSGQIINAIKEVRALKNLGLKEAKDFVEATEEFRAYTMSTK